MVWIVDETNRAIHRTVQVGRAGPNGLVEITSGLNAMDKLIVSGVQELSDGDVVIIRGEDQTLGGGR